MAVHTSQVLGAGVFLKTTFDQTNSTVTMADISGLGFSAVANSLYEVEAYVAMRCGSNTSAGRITIAGPSGATVCGEIRYLVASDTTSGVRVQAVQSFLAETSLATNANSSLFYPIFARFIVSIGGTAGVVKLQFKCSTAAVVATVGAGSLVKYRAL